MRRPVIHGLAALALGILLPGCDRGRAPPARPEPPAAASRPAGDGVAPETSAIVAREGDHLFVVVDIAPRDARGRKVVAAAVDVEASPGAARAKRAILPDRVTIEVRVPAGTREIKVTGTSEGGVAWSTVVPTTLDG